jgi:TolB protein
MRPLRLLPIRLLESARLLAAVVLVPCLCLPAAFADGDAMPGTGWSESFAELDADSDLRLSRDEFFARSGGGAQAGRDFDLFDFDGDGLLNKQEFAAVHAVASATERGPIPDPFDTLVTQAMEAIDESYDHWNLRPDESVSVRQFVSNFVQSISLGGDTAVSGRLLQQADSDSDQQVSRDEAFQFLEQQLGVRWGRSRLREQDGRVVQFAQFLAADDDRDGVINKSEFAAHRYGGQRVQQEFEINDRNDDGEISLQEYAAADGPNHVDPVAWFRDADQNLDALIDLGEMEAATIGRRRALIDSSFPGFDSDGDGKLSIQEYRLSMHANANYSWVSLPQDRSHDDRISFDEFRFDSWDLFQLQRRFYFHRLDTNHDDYLSPDEFAFKRHDRCTMVITSVDGTRSRELLSINAGTLSSPDVSPDGASIIFSRADDANVDHSKIALIDIGGERVTDLCDGTQPSWSADGRQFVCARTRGKREIWIMDSDGHEGRKIADGFAPQWSPDGQTIAYQNDSGLLMHDLETGHSREVVRASDLGYQYFWWNSCWSPDSNRMVLLGVSVGRSEAVIVNLNQERPEVRMRLSETVEMGNEFVWSPDAQRVIFPMRSTQEKRTRLFQMDPDSDEPPTPIAELDSDFDPKTGCFTPDGQWYISVIGP